MLERVILPEAYKVYRDKTKKELQERFHASDFAHIRLKCTAFRKIFKACGCKSVTFVEEHYCCNGPEKPCWEDPYWAGLWKMSERKVRRCLFDRIREIRPYLQDPESIYYKDPNETPAPKPTPAPKAKSKKKSSSGSSSKDPYNVKEYSSAEDFYYWQEDDFIDYEDAEDYWLE